MTDPLTAWNALGGYLRETQILGSIQSTLYWDQNTCMPSDGSAWRGEQLTLLASQLHARQSAPEYADLIAAARQEWSENVSAPNQCERGRNLDLLEQDLGRQQALDPALVAALATAKAKGYNCWQQARRDSDFPAFAPALQSLIDLRQEQARQFNEPRSCWETLAQPFEPDLSLTRLNEVFAPLRQRLPELVARSTTAPRPRMAPWDLSDAVQQRLCNQLLSSSINVLLCQIWWCHGCYSFLACTFTQLSLVYADSPGFVRKNFFFSPLIMSQTIPLTLTLLRVYLILQHLLIETCVIDVSHFLEPMEYLGMSSHSAFSL